MASEVVKIHGLRELEKKLNALPERIEKNVVRGALRAGARVIANEAKALVPVEDGTLKKSIRVSARVDRQAGQVRSKITAGNKEAFYAHMVEFGTAAHMIAPKQTAEPKKAIAFEVNGEGVVVSHASHPGAKEKPFMRPALDNKATAAVEAFAEYAGKRIEAEAKS